MIFSSADSMTGIVVDEGRRSGKVVNVLGSAWL